MIRLPIRQGRSCCDCAMFHRLQPKCGSRRSLLARSRIRVPDRQSRSRAGRDKTARFFRCPAPGGPESLAAAASEQFQEDHICHKAVLRVAPDGLSDIEPQQRSVRSNGLAGNSDSLERLAMISRQFVVEQAVIVESLEPELIREHEAVGEVAEDCLLGADRTGADAMNALRAEKSELVLREPIEALTIEIVQLEADALKLGKIKALGQLGAEVGECLLVRVVLRKDAPRLPRRPLVVVVERA